MSDVALRAVDDPAGPELEAYYRVDEAAFGLAPRPEHVEAKRPLVDPGRFLLASVGGVDAGVAGSFPFDLTLPGGAAVPVAGVSDVGVVPTHRRRGLLRALLDRLLDDSAGRGEAAAVLNASEASIYGRFGFGVATRWRRLEVDAVRARLRPHLADPVGSLELVPRDAAAPLLSRAHDRAGVARPGWLSRSERWWAAVLGDSPLYLGGGEAMVMVHTGPGGQPDGYAIYQVHHDWSTGAPSARVDVSELVAADVDARLALWGALLSHDLVDRVVAWVPPDEPLLDALVDHRAARVTYEGDHLWLRPLDVGRLLSSRTYAGSGELVLDVRDAVRLGTTGRYRLVAGADGATCSREDGAGADLELDVAELGSLVLGGGSARRLARVGRVHEHTPGAAALADGLFAVDPLPWCPTRF